MQVSIVLHEMELTTSRGSRELGANRLFTGDLGMTRPKPLVVESIGSQRHLVIWKLCRPHYMRRTFWVA